ncbi:MAG: hypothetical protein OEZ02_05570 [Anaerolineae bacterium]|nr:hypothetical protein [Anaerolineae bacterium]
MRKLFLFAALGLALLAITNQPAAAHKPDKGNQAGITIIPHASISYAYYRQFSSAGQVHIYQLDIAAGELIHAGINIPQLRGLENYGVDMALLGPGLPALPGLSAAPASDDPNHDHTAHPHNGLPAAAIAALGDWIDQGYGGVLSANTLGEDFYEPFTQTNYWGRQVLELPAPQTGVYFLVVWQPQDRAGKYVLDVGYEEVFGLADMLIFPKWWLDAQLYFNRGAALAAGALALAGAALFGARWLRTRKARP